jgi:hypothetical protein
MHARTLYGHTKATEMKKTKIPCSVRENVRVRPYSGQPAGRPYPVLRLRNIGCGIAWLIVFLLSLGTTAHAAEAEAIVDRTRIGLGESIELTVTVKGAEGTVDTSPIRDFKIMSGGTGTSVQIINGRMFREINHTYTLFPLKEGRLVIPPLTVTTDDGPLKTTEIVVTVTPKAEQKPGTENIFAEGTVSSMAPYEGEPIVYTFKLYSAVQIANARFQKPEFPGFTAKEVEKSQRNYRTVLNGREYSVTELILLLVPVGAGDKTIDPATLECDLLTRQQSRRSPFGMMDDPFFGQGRLERRIIRTEPVTVTVKPLPAFDGKGSFSGLVGSYDIRAQLDKPSLKVGESATLSVSVRGTGNILDAAQPEIPLPDTFKSYKDTPQENIKADTNGFSGEQVFRTALVPLKDGQYTIGPITLSFFDVATGRYQTRSTDPIAVSVQPSTEKQSPIVHSDTPAPEFKSQKKQVEFTGRDILPLKEDMNALETHQTLSAYLFWILLAAPAMICFGIRIFMARTEKKDDPASLMAQRADQALKDAGRPDMSAEGFLTCLFRALTSIILARAGIRGESLTYIEAASILLSKGFPQEETDAVIRLLENIDSVRFSGREMDASNREKLLLETREMVRKISK